MANSKLKKILVGLLLVLIALVLITAYRMYMTKQSTPLPDENTPEAPQEGFGGASEEELQEMLDAIAPEDGAGGLTEEEMAAALIDIRAGETESGTEPDITPEGEVTPLTEAEIEARLQELREEEPPSDNDTEITPE